MARKSRQQRRAERAQRRATPEGKKRRERIKKIAGRVGRAILTGGLSVPIDSTRDLARGAKSIIQKNRKKIARFVADRGGVEPSENPEELAVQAAAVRQQEIDEIQQDPENPYNTPEEAEELWEQEQAEEIEEAEYEGFEPDAFTAEAAGAILGIAKGAVNKIREKRFAKGKKFLGKSAGEWTARSKGGPDVNVDGQGNLNISGVTNEGSRDPLSTAIRDAKGGVVETNIRQYLPLILGAVVIFLFMRKK